MNVNIDAIRKLRGLRIKQLRIEKNLTQEELEKLSGVTRQTIIKIEAGEMGYNCDSEILVSETLNNLKWKTVVPHMRDGGCPGYDKN